MHRTRQIRMRNAMGRRAQTALDVACLSALPLALVACALLQFRASALMTLVTSLLALGLFFAGWERTKPGMRQILPAAVLTAAAVVGRIVFAAAPNMQPVTALCVIAGGIFGKRTGFMTGAMTGLLSSFFLGLGAWTPWQMYAWGLVGYVAGMIFCTRKSALGHNPGCRPTRSESMRLVGVLAFGFVGSFIFGLIMNTWTLVGFTAPISWGSAAVVYGAGLVFDLAHAISTVIFLALLYVPLEGRLSRVATKYALSDSRCTES